jgi:membrane-associated protease RseP (regulator of RpoE activity)
VTQQATPLPVVAPRELARHVGLFLAASASMAVTYCVDPTSSPALRAPVRDGLTFAGFLSLILLAHELGHYVAARIHRVDASLPFFIPMPFLSPFGTMGAVIRMRGTIPSRRALLDIGASGPLAGLALALPLYAWGIAHSAVVLQDPSLVATYGDSLLSRLLDLRFAPPVPDGYVQLASPTLLAAWVGLFVTMLNLLPIGQLDGGHVAYALLGKRQDRATLVVHRSLLAFFFVSLAGHQWRDLAAGVGFAHLGRSVNNSLFWLVWFEVLGSLGAWTRQAPSPRLVDDEEEDLAPSTRLFATVLLVIVASLGRDHPYPSLWGAWFVGLAVLLVMERRGGTLRHHTLFVHPDVGSQPMGVTRTVIAVLALALFVLLFMPAPLTL